MKPNAHLWSTLIRKGKVLDEICSENKKKKTHILSSVVSFSENRAIYDIMWK